MPTRIYIREFYVQYPSSIVKNSPSESLTPRSVNQYCLLPNKKGIHLYIYVQKHVVTEENTCCFFATSKACPPPSPIWSPHSDSCSRTIYTLSVSVNRIPYSPAQIKIRTFCLPLRNRESLTNQLHFLPPIRCSHQPPEIIRPTTSVIRSHLTFPNLTATPHWPSYSFTSFISQAHPLPLLTPIINRPRSTRPTTSVIHSHPSYTSDKIIF
jgi:hypothetical protein